MMPEAQLFFSVIIPTYNRAHLVAKAIDSVINQTFTNWELLVVDDGSKDNTQEVVEGYTDKRVKYIYQNNAERCAARNNGIERAEGKYICFLDSDDYYTPERLQKLYDELKNNEGVAAYYTGVSFSYDDRISIREEPMRKDMPILDFIAVSVIHSQQVCIHATILQKHKYDVRFNVGEDMELWVRIAAEYPFVYIPNQSTVVVIDHPDRTVNLAKNNAGINQIKTLQHCFATPHPGSKISESVRLSMLSSCLFNVAKYYIYNNARMPAALYVLKSILQYPASPQTKFKLNILIKLLSFKSFDFLKGFVK